MGIPVNGDDRGKGDDQSRNSSRPTPQTLVGGENLRFYHRPGCPMAADRNWSAASPTDHDRAGRVPCGMCRP
jgi:hypothetical protein